MKKNSQPRLLIPFTVRNKNLADLNQKNSVIIFIVLSIVLLLGISLLPKSPIPAASVSVPIPAASATTAH